MIGQLNTVLRAPKKEDELMLRMKKYADCAAEAIFCCPTENSHHLEA
jgi:hypothetical protein